MNDYPTGKILSGKLSKNHPSDAGQDIHSNCRTRIDPFSTAIVSTGLKIAVPEGCVALVWPRSGSSFKSDIETGAGVIDSDYRGEVKVKLYNHGSKQFHISDGDRIAQLITVPCDIREYEYADLEDHVDTERGDKGFGSSGK